MNKMLISLAVCLLFAGLASSLDKEKDCKCKIQTSSRIIGGKVAKSTDYPWHISMAMGEQESDETLRRLMPSSEKLEAHSCGGVIVNEHWILTAAHCIMMHMITGDRLSIGVGGDNDLVKIYNHGRIYVKRVISHPEFNTDNLANDIALLELEEPLNLTERIAPACLDNEKARKNYGNVVITGYGVTSKVIVDMRTGQPISKPVGSRFLKELDYKDISETGEKCQRFKGILCVDSLKGIRESGCYGDSGGPMHKTENGKTTVIGVTSGSDYNLFKDHYVIFCNGKAYYTRIGYYQDWIEQHVGVDNHC